MSNRPIGTDPNQLVVHGHLSSSAYIEHTQFPVSEPQKKELDQRYTKEEMPQATPGELNQGTEAGLRALSPKQLQDKISSQFKTKITLTESVSIPRPNAPEMLVVLYGAGGGRGYASSNRGAGGASGSILAVHIRAPDLLPSVLDFIVGAGGLPAPIVGQFGGVGGFSSFESFVATGGAGGRDTSPGVANNPNYPDLTPFITNGVAGVSGTGVSGGKNPPRFGLADPEQIGMGGGAQWSAGDGLIEIYY